MRFLSWLVILVFAAAAAGVLFLFGGEVLDRSSTSFDAEDPDVVAPVSQDQPLITFIDPRKGAENGDILIVEYGDLSCPYCRAMEPSIDRLIAEYPGRVTFVWKTLVNTLYPGSQAQAEAALCAKEQGMFWEYRNALFNAPETRTDTDLAFLATNLDLNTESFTTCITSHRTTPVIERNIEEARALGVDGFPYLFINGERFSGQMTYEQLKAQIAQP